MKNRNQSIFVYMVKDAGDYYEAFEKGDRTPFFIIKKDGSHSIMRCLEEVSQKALSDSKRYNTIKRKKLFGCIGRR